MIIDSAKNVRWVIPFKKLGMVRVKLERFKHYKLHLFRLHVRIVKPPGYHYDTCIHDPPGDTGDFNSLEKKKQ